MNLRQFLGGHQGLFLDRTGLTLTSFSYQQTTKSQLVFDLADN